MAMPDLSHRNNIAELMDSGDTDFPTFRACLRDLAKVNRLTLAYRPTLNFLEDLSNYGHWPRGQVLKIVDVGSGAGDMLRKIDDWAAWRGLRVDLTGVDLNPWSAQTAKEATPTDRPIGFVTSNIFDYRPAETPDIVISSLFTHHLDDATLIQFIKWMETNTKIGWFVNDLRRHPLPYHFFKLASRLLRMHYFVQHDGPVSIARAFDIQDWLRALDGAGIEMATLRAYFPYRLCVARVRRRA
jgi:2-polyprenyl-3-methyl-5-hydroxy-6-metoxy-1,4-benzoquinol methylase